MADREIQLINDEQLKFIYLSKIYGILPEIKVSKIFKKLTQQYI